MNTIRHAQHHAKHQEQGTMRRNNARIICNAMRAIGLNPTSIIDYGCGYGYFLEVASNIFSLQHYKGLDGPWVDANAIAFDAENFVTADLSTEFNDGTKYDMASCLEVAEHVEERSSRTLVRSLTESSELILFSAAIPGQGGQGHCNEQYLDYWANRFSALDYLPVDILRFYVWDNTDLSLWFRQNLIIFASSDALRARPDWRAHVPDPRLLRRVHPGYFDRMVKRVRSLEKDLPPT